ncbi:hypothetical protein HK28_10935 [Acetobacter sp. DsW_063]|nr:hypothetical protein HK28_10935 [Acetobacter sp. DsW_063]
MAHLLNTDDFRIRARKRLPKGLFDYLDRGTEDERGLERNRRAFDQIKIVPSFLKNVSNRRIDTTILDTNWRAPLAVAPTALAGLVWPEGEQAMARAASRVGVPVCVSTMSVAPIEDIAAASTSPPWFQLYVWDDREATYGLINRVKSVGVEVLVVTVDGPVNGNREYNIRNGFGFPFQPSAKALLDIARHPSWTISVLGRQVVYRKGIALPHFPEGRQRGAICTTASLTWDDIRTLRGLWRGKLLLKGILHPADAQFARKVGVDGIIVSNHGARNLDSAPSPLEMLPTIANENGDEIAILLDSGIRRGSDIFKALACGAHGVMVGRAPLWGLAAGGEQGAYDILCLLLRELDRTMGHAGCCDLNDVDQSRLVFDDT